MVVTRTAAGAASNEMAPEEHADYVEHWVEAALGMSSEELRRAQVGDCLAPRSLDHVVYEGYLADRGLWPAHPHPAAIAEAADS